MHVVSCSANHSSLHTQTSAIPIVREPRWYETMSKIIDRDIGMNLVKLINKSETSM